MKKSILASVLGILSISASLAQYEPGWQAAVGDTAQAAQTAGYSISAPPPVSQGGIQSAGAPGNNADFITPEIEALAAGLAASNPGPTNLDTAKRIFDYVHNNITYLHYYGCKKGAALTLWERSGNDFDQAALLVALLRSAGYTASYQYGLQDVEFSQNVADWLRFDFAATNYMQMATHIAQLAGSRRYPDLIPGDGADNSTTVFITAEQTFIFPRLWVVLTINSVNYYLDPVFKESERIQGIDLASAIGSSKTNLLTAASLNATYQDPDWVKQLNATNLNAKLTAYTTNLLGYLRDQAPNASPEEILGGWRVVPANLDALPTSTTWGTITNISKPGCGPCPVLNWEAIPDLFISSLHVLAVGGNAGTLDQTFQFAGLQGQRLSLMFTNTSPKQTQVWLEDTLLATETGGAGTNLDIGLLVNHAKGTWNYTSNTLDDRYAVDQGITNTFQRTTNGYVILYAFEPSGDLLRARQNRLAEYKRANYADTSREVLTETLNVIGQNWLFQTALSDQILGAQNHLQISYAHRVGRMGQELGFYVDVGCQLSEYFSAGLRDANQLQVEKDVFDLTGYFNSAMEHGVLEQMQSCNAASTVKLLKVGNGISTNKIYRMTAGNWSANNGGLVNYDKSMLATRLSGGSILLLPSDGRITVDQWRGTGYSDRRDSSQERSLGMIISGGLYGGNGTTPGIVSSTPLLNFYGSSAWILNPSPVVTPTFTGADPVNMVDGSFTVSSVDLSVGQADPRGFAFSRQYSSKQNDLNRSHLGFGWTHNYLIYANDQSDVRAGLGLATPYEMAAYVVATRAAMDVYASSGTAREWATLALIAQWGVDRLRSNAVSIVLGKDAVQFARQPDGSLIPSAGITMTLTNSGGKYVLSQRLGNTFYFDSSNRVMSIKAPTGQTNLFKYDSSGRLTNVIDAYSRKLAIAYNTSNLISVVSDGTGRQISLGYDNARNLTTISDPEGKTSSYVYDTLHRILATRDGFGRTITTNIYDDFARVVEQYTQGVPNKRWRLFYMDGCTIEEDPAGARKSYFLDQRKRTIGLQDAKGHLSQLVYDGQDHVISSITPLSEASYSDYDANHNLRRTINPLGHTNLFFYDSLHRLTNTIDAHGFPRYIAYNGNHQVTKTTDASGHWVQFSYTNALLQSRTDDAGNSVSLGYDQWAQLSRTVASGVSTNYFTNNARGDMTAHRDGRGFATLYEYNNRRQPTRTTGPTNLWTQMTYDDAGYLLTVTDPRQNVTTYSNSATGKRLSATLPAIPAGNGVWRYGYDLRDWVTSTANPLLQTNCTFYDAAGNVSSQFNPLQQGAWFGYDEDNRLRASTNGLLEATQFGYDARGLRISLTDPAQEVIRYGFDANGNQLAITNRRNAAFTAVYDANNRLATNSTPLSKKTISTYETRGLLASLQEPSGDTNGFRHDLAGRLTNRTDNIGVLTYRYDANNNLTNLHERTWNSATQNVYWSFDAYNHVATYRDAGSNLLQYSYDDNGNLKKLVYPGGKEVNYSYDSQNHLTNVTDWASRTTSFEYDLAGNLRVIRRPNQTSRSIDYDAAGRMTNIVERAGSSFVIAQFKTGWNAASRMDWEFTAPLPHEDTHSVPSMTHDADNRIETFNGTSVTHDDDGNMTWGPVTNTTSATYTYDARNRLLGVGGASHAYDPQGNRVAVTNGTNVTRFVVNPNAALSQVLMRINGGVTNFYVYGIGLLYEVTVGTSGIETATNTYHFDYRGSTVALTDAGGNVRDRMEYSAYGLLTYRPGTNDTPFLFNGRYGVQTDPSGLLYMRARYYNPYLCRFVNPDPSGFAGGMNWYAYADGNPVSMIDPFGLGARESGGLPSWLNYNTIATAIVPGQAAWNNAVNSFLSGNYGSAVLSTVQTFGETALFVATWGQSSSFTPATQAVRPFAEVIKDAAANPSAWQVIKKEIVPSLNLRNNGGTSVQELLRNEKTGEEIVRHTLLKPDGTIFDPSHFRPFWK